MAQWLGIALVDPRDTGSILSVFLVERKNKSISVEREREVRFLCMLKIPRASN